MQRWRILSKKKRFRWIAVILVVIVLVISLAHQLLFKERENEKDALIRITERGQLIALTDANSLNYFVYQGNPIGYQLDLLRELADELGVSLKIIVSNDISELYYYLDLHIGDLIALNLPVTHEGRLLVNFMNDMGETRLVLLQRKPGTPKGKRPSKLIRSFGDFSGDTVHYRSNAFFSPLFRKFYKETGSRITLVEEKDRNPEQLARDVSEGKLNYMMCPENLAKVLVSAFSNLDAEFVLGGSYTYSWGTGHSSPMLQQKINEWMNKKGMKKHLEEIAGNYFENPGIVNYFQNEYCTLKGTKISPFDKEIKKQSRLIMWDWRLLASLIYEESNFRTGKVSGRSASGLMQLMPVIARQFGMDSTSSPAAQINAGVKYLRWLDQQLPEGILDGKERVNFILAAYNVGLGRIISARAKARKYGKNPNIWYGNVDYYLTSKSKKHPVEKPDTTRSYSPPEEGAGYVNEVIERYYHYRNLIPR